MCAAEIPPRQLFEMKKGLKFETVKSRSFQQRQEAHMAGGERRYIYFEF